MQEPGSAGCEQGGEQGFQVHVGQAVDAGQAVGRRDLDQAQPRVVCLFPNELRIESHQRRFGDGVDQFRQGTCVVDESV